MKHYFKITGQDNQVIFGRIDLWNGQTPENFNELSQEEKEAWKPTNYKLLKFSSTKTIKANVLEFQGFENNLPDATQKVINEVKKEWGWKSTQNTFKTNLNEEQQKYIDETLDNEIKATKELKEAFTALEYI